MGDYLLEPLKNNVEEMFIGPFGSSLKNDCFVDKENAFCMVYEQKHAIQKTMNVETRYVDEKKYSELSRFNVRGGDIIVSCRGTIGETFIVPDDAPLGIMHPSIMKIRLKDGVYNKEYFNALLLARLKKHESEANGSGIKMAISAKALGEELFPVPPIKAQERIARTLGTIKETIGRRNREIELLDELIKARFVEMFGDLFKGSMIKVGDIADVYIGLTYKPENVSKSGTIVLRSGNIQNQSLQIKTDVVRVSGLKIADNKYVKDKDILMCARNGSARLVGKSCLIRDPKEKMAFGAFMSVIRTSYPFFLQGFFSSDYFKNQLTNVGTTSVNQITSKMLNNYDVVMPTKEQEEEFAIFCDQVDKSKVAIQKSLDETQILFDSLMQKYFG